MLANAFDNRIQPIRELVTVIQGFLKNIHVFPEVGICDEAFWKIVAKTWPLVFVFDRMTRISNYKCRN